MKRIIITNMLIMLTLTISAQQISIAEASRRATEFLQTAHAHRTPAHKAEATENDIQLAYTSTRDEDQKVCFYIFNEGNNGGFVIIGGDEAAKDILGYSETGTFAYDSIPDNFKWWLSQYKQQISYAIDNESESSSAKRKAMRKASSISRTDIGPLVTAKWNQGEPYNNLINSEFTSQTGKSLSLVTGCVATAMAQVMKYHKCPATGTGSHKESAQAFTIDGTACTFTPSANFASTTYDWDKMLDSYSGSYSDDNANAVATLMYHCGVGVDMEYGTSESGGSGAYSYKISTALTSYFGYDKSMRYEKRNYYTDDAWEDMIYNELANGRPVIYGGQAASGGHQFVCDGYRTSDGLYSFNWGWGAYCDGYYALTGDYALKPNGSGIGGAGTGSAYTTNQDALIGVKPDKGGMESPVLTEYRTGTICLKDGSTTYSSYEYAHTGTSKTLTLYENVWNLSANLTSFTLGVKATDTTTGAEYYWAHGTESIPQNYEETYELTFDLNDIPYNGTYEIRAVGRNINSSSNNDWYDVEVRPSVTTPTVTITNAINPTKTDLTISVPGNSVQVKRTLQIAHDELYTGTISYTSSDEKIATVDANGLIKGVSEGTVTITAQSTETTYFNATTQTFTIEVTELIKEDPTIAITATDIVVGKTASIIITSTYDGTPAYTTSNADVATIDNGVITAIGTGTAEITVTLPATDLFNANTATFDITVSQPKLLFVKTPYLCYNNNPWANDMNLYVPLENTTSEAYQGTIYALVYVNGGYITWILTTSSIEAGKKAMNVFDLSQAQSYFEEGVNTSYKIEFYRDASLSDPFNYPSITYTYRNTLTATASKGYGTLILPIDATIPDGLTVYSCTAVGTDNTLALTEESSIKANTPYITYNTGDVYTFTGPNVVDDNGTAKFKSGLITGLVRKSTVPQGSYVLQTQNGVKAFYQVGTAADGSALYGVANRCYLTLPADVKGLYINSEEETSIPTTSAPTSLDIQSIYTLNGTQVGTLQKGLNIVKMTDGTVRKILVK